MQQNTRRSQLEHDEEAGKVKGISKSKSEDRSSVLRFVGMRQSPTSPNRGGFGQLHHDDDTRNPPMCGQVIITKILGNHQKTHNDHPTQSDHHSSVKKWMKQKLFLRKHASSSGGYDDMISLEQPLDTESDSSRASSDQRQEGILPYIVQFDPTDSEHVKKEKADTDPKAARKGHSSPKGRSPFWETSLPTVTEEMSFESETSASQAGRPPQEASLLTTTLSTCTSASSSSFFEGINSTDSNDDEVEETYKERKTEIRSENTESTTVSQRSSLSSPEKMELLCAMRQMILKQQAAIKDISEQNLDFKQKLASCQNEIKDMRRDSEEQQVRIAQLVLQKEAFASESTWLRAEVDALKGELAHLKSDDDLQKRFASLMEDDTKSNSDDSSSSASDQLDLSVLDSFEKEILLDSPNDDDAINKIADDREWNRMMSTFDNADVQLRKLKQTGESRVSDNDKPSTNAGQPGRHEEVRGMDESAPIGSNAVSTSAGTMAKIDAQNTKPSASQGDDSRNAVSTSAGKMAEIIAQFSSHGDDSTGRKKEDVAEFKNRLGELQKKRMMRKRSRVQPGKTSVVRFE
jgi:hypothetical protein